MGFQRYTPVVITELNLTGQTILHLTQDGNVYFTDPKSYDPALPDGRVFRIDNKTKEVRIVAEDIAFSNGLAFSPNGKYLFVCESAKNQIIKFDVLPNGNLGERSVFIKLPGGDPDGIAFDVDGKFICCSFWRRSYLRNFS